MSVITFIIGFLIGVFIGIVLMCALQVIRDAEEELQ